jgi:PIN domain nuclease of toxin-antitoxin system
VKLLLDTHLLLWWLAGDPELPRSAKVLIADPGNTVFVSAVTMWEIYLKQSLGKLRLPPDFDSRLSAEPFEMLALRCEHTSRVRAMPWHHRDPFDRMLVAQAQAEGMTLLTSDKALRRYGACVVAAQ